MDKEKDFLRQDLNKQEQPEDIKKFIEDAEMLGHEDIAELGRKKLQEVSEKAGNIKKTNETQTQQVENMGGNIKVIAEITKEVDKEIEKVKTETQKKIKDVQNEGLLEKKEIVNREEFSDINSQIKILIDKNSKNVLSQEEKEKLTELKQKKEELIKKFLDSYDTEKITIGGIESIINSKIITLNKITGLEIPVFGKDLSTYEFEGKKYLTIATDSFVKGFNEDSSFLAKKQIEILNNIKLAVENVGRLSKEVRDELMKEIELEKEVILGDIEDQHNPIKDIFTPIVRSHNGSLHSVKMEDSLYPKEIEGFNGQKFNDPVAFREYMSYKASRSSIMNLLLEKRAKEKGLI